MNILKNIVRLTELQNYVNESIPEVTLRYILLQEVSEISHIFKTSDIPPSQTTGLAPLITQYTLANNR